MGNYRKADGSILVAGNNVIDAFERILRTSQVTALGSERKVVGVLLAELWEAGFKIVPLEADDRD